MAGLIAPDSPAAQHSLRLGLVLSTTEESCTVVADDECIVVGYLAAFPGPRTERVLPGHLVAIEDDGTAAAVVWRWYDAVVLGQDGALVRVWEPAHGPVLATPRDPQRRYRSGTRAYLSAGLPGADWWVAGPAADRAEDADVELPEVSRFLDAITGRTS
jgi:hypothetical protein